VTWTRRAAPAIHRPLPRRPRPIKLRPLASGNGSAHLTLPAWVLEAVGLAPGDSVLVTPVPSNPDDESSVAQIVIVNAVKSKRKPLTETTTRWSEAGAWKLKLYGKRAGLGDGGSGSGGGGEGEDEDESRGSD
jgi:hypothetical protein